MTANDADHRYAEGRAEGEAHLATEEKMLAAAIQAHVGQQPSGHYGNRPVPVEIFFDKGEWTVKFVLSLTPNGRGRHWRWTSAGTLVESLREARSIQVKGC